jgi:UDP-N-acetylmuramoyl-L-alanyl-D-glutamate--2,6-diaminopimelate ligase
VVGEKSLKLAVPYKKVGNGRLAWAQMVAEFCGHPEKKMKFIGVTGTDGKTTTVNILAAMLKKAGIRTGMSSTVGAVIGKSKVSSKVLQTGSPSPDVLFPLLLEMKKKGMEMVVLETTSHGLNQDRFGDIIFEVGVITNLASDHMEYHGNIKEYRRVKARVIDKSKKVVLNELGGEYEYFKRKASKKAVSFNRKKGVRNVSYVFGGNGIKQRAEIKYGSKWVRIETLLLGDYNLENILAVGKVAELFGIKQADFVEAINNFVGVEGRLVRVANNKGVNAMVDFAHTEQGLKGILSLVNTKLKKKDEKIIVVFGCNGDRDRTKRAPMGKVAAKLSDVVIITNEDPRNEDPGQIFEDIEKGLKKGGMKFGKSYFREDDREKAIEKAVRMAKKGDWVLCLGKGHEKTINIGSKFLDWDEREVLRKALL